MIDPKTELTTYARNGSETAFSRLADHYAGLVFNSALRRVRDPGLAEETAQNVFAHLARKAPQVSKYRSISAWLFETTRLESAKTLRTQHRHQRRLEALSATPPPSTMTDDPDRELRDLLPHLEESLDSLKPGERQILLARFFDNQSFPDIAISTGKSESACKMSLRRTLEKLHLKLSSRGISFSAITLGTLLQTEWAKATPPHLASSLANTAMAAQSVGWTANFYSSISTPKILTLVAVTFLGIACHQIIQSDSKNSTSPDQAKTPVTNSTSGVSKSRFSNQKRSTRKIRKQTHQASDLKHFYLPPTDLKSISLEAAGKIVIEKYETICRETGEIPLPLVWEVNSDKAQIKEIHLSGRFLHICQKLAIVSGASFKRKGANLTFYDLPQSSDGLTNTREFKVPPTFQTWFDNFPNKRSPHMTQSPFGEQRTSPYVSEIDFTPAFRKGGLIGEDETVRFDRSQSDLIVDANKGSMARIEALINLAIGDIPVQIRYISQSGLNGAFTDLPNIVALPGQTATLEIGKEYLEFDGDEVTEAWIGHRLEIAAELYGLGERSTLDYSYIEEPSEQALAKYKESGRLDDLRLEEFRIDQEVILKSAEDRLGNFGMEFHYTDRDGNDLSLRIQSERIDATGRPVMPR